MQKFGNNTYVLTDLLVFAMSSQVVFVVGLIAETFPASISAFEWFFSCVDSHVDLQIRRALEHFSASRMFALMNL